MFKSEISWYIVNFQMIQENIFVGVWEKERDKANLQNADN